MNKFFEMLISKFFDFFNFGRFITIVIPGLLATMCFLMFVSQLVFPIEAGKDTAKETIKETTKETAKDSSSGTKKNAKNETSKEVMKETVRDSTKVTEMETRAESIEALFSKQIAKDFLRIADHFYLVLIMSIVIGLMLYEVGYAVLTDIFKKSGTEDIQKMFPYNSEHDADQSLANKFKFVNYGDVGLVYFAPFLKEKFSGDANYFDFLVTEYYRFLEFSVNMPLSILGSTMFAVAYYVLFCTRHNWVYLGGLSAVFVFLAVFSLVFLCQVSPRICSSYVNARKDLIHGVSDFMSKNLIKPS